MNNTKSAAAKRFVRKGFTLLEMMIVLAIIGILTTILIPTITSYITRSRLNTANANAKVIFNSLQTIVQEYEFNERPVDTSVFYGSPKALGVVFLANDQGVFTSVTSTTNAALSISSSDVSDTTSANSLTSKMSRLFADYQETSWRALVDGYTVRVVVAATSNSTDYIGCYPGQSTTERGEIASGLSSVTETMLRAKANSVWPGLSL